VVTNITIICHTCNQEKGALLPDEFVAWRTGMASRIDKGVGWRCRKVLLPRTWPVVPDARYLPVRRTRQAIRLVRLATTRPMSLNDSNEPAAAHSCAFPYGTPAR
jgi:hypothetical protein